MKLKIGFGTLMMVSRGGRARMVDISGKTDIIRIARASGVIHLKESTLERVSKGSIEKGDPLAVGEVAATLAAKQTPSLIPLCHPIPITSVNLDFKIETDGIRVTSEVKSLGKTGVEMEALTAVALALLTIWDMVKQYEKDREGQYPKTVIDEIRVVHKRKMEGSPRAPK